MRLLCLSDVHGYLDALSAVMATAERRSFHKLLVAGDLVFPGPEPLETWRRLVAAGAVMVQGLTDKALATLDPAQIRVTNEREQRALTRMKEVRDELGTIILERLRRLPTHVRVPLEDGGELVLVHGSPSDPGEGMSHDLDDDELLALVGTDPADIVVCGMTHVPFDRVVGGLRVVNVGSVGEAPDEPPVAHATWIETTSAGVIVEPFTVPLPRSVIEARREMNG